jgi:hypothetical protein
MVEVPNTRLFNFVATPADIRYTQYGEAQVPLDPKAGHIIDVSGFRKVSLKIGGTKAKTFSVFLGVILNGTLAQEFSQTVDNAIHTFDLVGPEMSLWLKGGGPGSQEKVKLWVFLRS